MTPCFKKNFINYLVVIFVYDSNSGLGTVCHIHKHTTIKITEHKSIVYYHGISKVYTNKLAIKNPNILPKLDFDDHIPTNLPSFLTLKWWLKIVSVAGKKLSWKKPNTPNEAAIIIWSKTEPSYTNYYYLNNEMIGIIENPMIVGIAVYRHAWTGLLELTIE